MPDAKPESIHVLLSKVMADLPAIGKNSENKDQHYKFRGIEDIKAALAPVMAKHGVFYVPTVRERIAEERTTKSGAAMHVVHLRVQYRFFGPENDNTLAMSSLAEVWGEGSAMDDKATSKAMTAAEKAALIQVFCISDKSTEDGDLTTPEDTVPTPPKNEKPTITDPKILEQHEAMKVLAGQLDPTQLTRLKKQFPKLPDTQKHIDAWHAYYKSVAGQSAQEIADGSPF